MSFDCTINEIEEVKSDHKIRSAPPFLLENNRFPTTDEINNFLMGLLEKGDLTQPEKTTKSGRTRVREPRGRPLDPE